MCVSACVCFQLSTTYCVNTRKKAVLLLALYFGLKLKCKLNKNTYFNDLNEDNLVAW